MPRLHLLAVAALLIVVPGAVKAQGCGSLQDIVNRAAPGATVDVPPCTFRETVFISRPVTLDGHGAATIDGDGIRPRWLWIAADDVTIRGFVMRNASTPNQSGAIQNMEGIARLLFTDNDLGATTGGEQIGITTTTDSKILRNDIHDGGQMAIGTFSNTRLLVQGNHLHGNNTSNTDPWFAAGGMKAIAETDLQVLDNEVDHNAGPGIWCDIGCDRVLIARNNVHDQSYNPIFYEISSHAEITDNIISTSSGEGVWGCVVVSSSGSTYVHGNTCTDSVPLRAQLETRADRPADAGTNVRLEDNLLIRSGSQATSWWQQDSSGPLVPGTNGNTDLRNVLGLMAAVRCEVEVWLDGASQGRKSC